MNKKILIGSIIAVVILVLVSFTGVVGYQSTKSSTIARASPLFTVRSSRAINEESKDLTCDYVGKGINNNIAFPTKNSRVELLDRFANIIGKMDDKSYDKFIDLVIKNIQERDDFQEYHREDIILYFNLLRNNPTKIIIDNQDREESNLHTYECTITWDGCPMPTLENDGKLLCILFYLLLLLLLLIVS